MVFRDRIEAAERLAGELSSRGLENPLVLGIPRGAAPMAAVIADRLNGEADVVLVHKFCPPWHPELAIGAVTEEGDVILNRLAQELGIDEHEASELAAHEIQKLRDRRRLYTPHRRAIDVHDRDVIIVDDGIATGSTMLAAIMAVRKKKAKRLVVAAPVASKEAAAAIGAQNVETCFLDLPSDFNAVSLYFVDFGQVTDSEVITVLEHARGSHRPESSPSP